MYLHKKLYTYNIMFAQRHSLHSLIIGVMIYFITGNPLYGTLTTVGLYAYMRNFGHNIFLL